MKYFQLNEKIADYLLETLLLRMHGYTVALDVRIEDVQRNGKPLTSSRTAPLLICDADRVLCGIALDYDTASCYNLDMQGLPYAQFFPENHSLPMGLEDESWLDHISQQTWERLLASLKRILIPRTLRGEGQNSYRLCAIPAQKVFSPAQADYKSRLQSKQLIKENGAPTPYGSAHGLFRCWGADSDGCRFSRLLVPQEAVETLQRMVEPPRKKRGKQPLALRLQQLPDVEERSVAAALEALKKKPMDVLLQGNPEALAQLAKVLSVCQALLPENPAQSVQATYRQVLQLLQLLRQGFGTDATLDDWQSARMRRVSETVLSVLAKIFIPGETARKPAAAQQDVRRSLQQRLAENSGDPAAVLAAVSLAAYYQAVSVLTDSGYPNWLYQTQIRPLIENQDKPESAYTLRFLAVYCKLCIEEDADGWKEGFPLLYCLLLPECLGEAG